MTEMILAVLDWIGYPMGLLLQLPFWAGHLIVGVLLTYSMGLGGWVLVRAGRSPLWVLLMLVPYLNLLGIWVLAYIRWPRITPPQN